MRKVAICTIHNRLKLLAVGFYNVNYAQSLSAHTQILMLIITETTMAAGRAPQKHNKPSAALIRTARVPPPRRDRQS